MTDTTYRALVVDDEALVRNLTIRALSAEGFQCDAAVDGAEAMELFQKTPYDVVVTDILMPNKHGHALAAEILAEPSPPLVVVLTGVLEPKIAKDLIARGVSHIEFKPVRFRLFAAKVNALAAQHRARRSAPAAEEATKPAPAKTEKNSAREARSPARKTDPTFDLNHFEAELGRLSKILPISQAAFDVFSMTSSNTFEAYQVAAAVARDPSLSADVLRLANSPLYNASTSQVDNLEQAVVRIGQKRIGELALATSALTAVTSNALHWMNLDIAWQRSMAAGIAVELLHPSGRSMTSENGLFLIAILHPLGRIALGMLFPGKYEEMVAEAEETGDSLNELELRSFPISHGEVLAKLLQIWKIPRTIYEPLNYLGESYESLSRLNDPLRTKVETAKLAVLIGNIAVGHWESWDRLELPPAPTIKRLGLEDFTKVIEQTRRDLKEIIHVQKGTSPDDKETEQRRNIVGQIAYCNLSPEPFDFIRPIVGSMGIRLIQREPEVLQSDETVLVNGIWTPFYRLAAHINPRIPSGEKVIVCDAGNRDACGRFGRVASVPGSYGGLQRLCLELARQTVGVS